ncbi:chondroitin sulfate [Cyanidiococcus yangmingshanensis]|uniref:Chondroitin sulfate n=1 Tax=Cyanidiococcus yangmingshanensis TaxID=2690220 RepID=A0A7J7ILD7_9RHOD|nr:chondroitin sulfate [Cyanidiococcus yangmingshanensis]
MSWASSSFSPIAIGIVTCTSNDRHRCDHAKRHVALVQAQLRTWAADALHYGATIVVASDAPWPEEAGPLPAEVHYIWFPVPSPRALRLGFQRHASREGVFRPESNRTRQMLAHALAVLPSSVRFFVKIDDDAYLRLHRLAPLLRLIDPARHVYLGSVRTSWGRLDPVNGDREPHEQNNTKSDHVLEYAMGGAGYVLTRPLAEQLASRVQECTLYNGEDKDLAVCLRSCQGIEAVNFPGFWYGPPETAPPQQRDAMVAFHKLNGAAEMELVHRRYGMHAECARVDAGGDLI